MFPLGYCAWPGHVWLWAKSKAVTFQSVAQSVYRPGSLAWSSMSGQLPDTACEGWGLGPCPVRGVALACHNLQLVNGKTKYLHPSLYSGLFQPYMSGQVPDTLAVWLQWSSLSSGLWQPPTGQWEDKHLPPSLYVGLVQYRYSHTPVFLQIRVHMGSLIIGFLHLCHHLPWWCHQGRFLKIFVNPARQSA